MVRNERDRLLSPNPLLAKLANSRYGTPESIAYTTKRFDETTKRLFRDPSEAQVVAFGSPVDRDPSFGIRNGQLRMTGYVISIVRFKC